MNALELLRSMHSDTKFRLKTILGSGDSAEAHESWQALQPLLEVHERLEDEYIYAPLADEFGTNTPLGDWVERHDADVANVELLIADVDTSKPGSPSWRMAVGRVTDTLTRHVMDEEGQIFGRIEQAWDAARLAAIGEEMQKVLDNSGAQPAGKRRTRAQAARGRR